MFLSAPFCYADEHFDYYDDLITSSHLIALELVINKYDECMTQEDREVTIFHLRGVQEILYTRMNNRSYAILNPVNVEIVANPDGAAP